ncbi:Methionine import system permease protein MetP,DL-methionine transporter permease subunit,ABC-type phosphate transport system, permease component,phosphonate ABC transporter, permease protein PhnE,Binding-protein-dependent transport system inner membrane component [Chlamydia serpentis]|uniref:ABC transmembrane type-1 domain-containing protein n=1 Tax=Chlamydia serpentis TaxID=1967782 RepID=A0A2R8FAJ6_9CHLA|nr:methionine ABC transporter permease [Chlamydia serpentis]SPN73424.1 Methionine import system permease protein MetP,DL-methionine transporter permease subunit,ABC-type phosphate transport system, permease component,phosphonate ABC transporter, permease protein PhnE,Binding-protein-dependent transport system inner membrane component [Chlamydia serpentis]
MQSDLIQILLKETINTFYMVFSAFFFACLFGGMLGLGMFYTSPNSLNPKKSLYAILSIILSFLTAIPFAILIVILFPITRWIIGTSLGPTASIVPLTIGTIPFVVTIVVDAFRTSALNYLEAAVALGIPKRNILFDILLPESYPQLVFSLKSLFIHLISCSTLAGFVGGGGLGQLLLQYGYYRFEFPITVSVLVITLALIESIRILGDVWGRCILRCRGIL